MRHMVIPAKAHSRRVPGKNMKPFCGFPLVGWSIIQGLASSEVNDVWVSTDSEEIAGFADSLGAKVWIRGYKDDDDTPGGVPIKEMVDAMVGNGNWELTDVLISRLCTTPTLLPGDVTRFVRMWKDNWRRFESPALGCGCARRTLIIGRRLLNGVIQAIPPEYHCHNDYGIVEMLAFIGANFVGDFVNTNRTYAALHCGMYYPFERWQMQDVDTLEEWEMAEVLAEHYILKGRTPEEVYYGVTD